MLYEIRKFFVFFFFLFSFFFFLFFFFLVISSNLKFIASYYIWPVKEGSNDSSKKGNSEWREFQEAQELEGELVAIGTKERRDCVAEGTRRGVS